MSWHSLANTQWARGAILVGSLLLTYLLSSQEVSALDIQLSFSGGFENRPQAMAAMEQAAAAWEFWLADPVVLEIKVREESLVKLPFGSAGVTFPKWYEETYTDIRAALVQDQTSAEDQLATVWLPPEPSLQFQTWDAERNPVVNDGDDWINHWLLLPRAQVKALGIPVDSTDTNADAEILWSDFDLDRTFDFDRSDGIDGTDFQAVATHEIGHALGFASATDTFDQLHAGLLGITPEEIYDYSVLLPLDLFRYSLQSPTLMDVTPGNDAYFSLDGGTTSLGTFATGETFGDGWQSGHWKVGAGQGIMDANLSDDQMHDLTALDLRAMDAIGWDLAQTGDYDLDGDVDGKDFLNWQRGESPNPLSATDLAAWQMFYGSATPDAASSQQVPEPNALLLATFALAGVMQFQFLRRTRESLRTATPTPSSALNLWSHHETPFNSSTGT